MTTAVDERFAAMGGTARIMLEDGAYAAEVRAMLEEVERHLSRFDPASELCALNADPRAAVPVSPLLARFVAEVAPAGRRSGGLVDATLLPALERAGYTRSRAGVEPAPLGAALAAAPARRPASPSPAARYDEVRLDERGRAVRPPGLRLDSGGLGKGLAADLAAARVPTGVRFAISCGGDLAVGGGRGRPWRIPVEGVFSGRPLGAVSLAEGGVATSGLSSRLWLRDDGRPAHHLLDPATGEPAWTGLVAVTAVAGSALEAEVLAKAALLSGPRAARRMLRAAGGVLQHESGRVEILDRPVVVRLPAPALRRAA